MAADMTWKSGDVLPILLDTLTFQNNEPVDLEGAEVKFVMRSLTASEPVKLTGTVAVQEATAGKVSYSPSTSDTSTPGNYMANWVVDFSGGKQMQFPTTGYISIEIEPSLTVKGVQQLVSLPDLKQYLSIPASDRTNDTRLIRWLEAVAPIVENITGPLRMTQREEWHDGGQYFIQLRRRPSTAYGTTPVFNLIACEEFRGPIPYDLSIVQNPAFGSIYSCFFEPLRGIVTRRTSGGGVMAFPPQSESVHVLYQAGQEVIPPNVYEAVLECAKLNWSSTQATGRGSLAFSEEETGPPMGFFMSRRILEMLAPNRRKPSIA